MKSLQLSHARWLLLIFLIAASLRLINLGAKSFWLDEAFSVTVAKPALEQVDNNNPPLFYTALYHWTDRFGNGETAARLPSAILSILNVGLLYLLARQLSSREVALLAAALLALSPLNAWYAQEARLYTWLVFVALLMALGLAWKHGAGFVLYFAGLSVGLYLGYLVFPLWVGLSSVWFVLWWQRGHRLSFLFLWTIASAAAWWLYRPWLPHFESWLQKSLLNHWMFVPVREALDLAELTMAHFLVVLAAVAVFLSIAAALVPVLLARERWRHWMTIAVLGLFGGFLILVPVPRLYGMKRVIVTGWPFVILFTAWLIVNLNRWREPVRRAVLGLSLVTTLVTLFLVPKDDWRSVASYLDSHLNSPESVVWVDPRWNYFPHNYYRPEHPAQSGDLQELQAAVAENGEIWLIAERFHGRPVPSGPHEAWLNQHLQLLKTVPFYRLEVRHYRFKQQ